ncbi:uncharacterized protein PG998_012860 [Apiospora kogelbergensis]|uniref:uncharacterized protein n=1 Tax=Apiospora kogelbergensis TaxID=1337665 RepID=UPI003130B309
MDVSGITAIDSPQEPSRDPGARRQGGNLDPNKYRKLITKHSTITISTSIFSGHEYEALADFLNETGSNPVRRHNDIENEAIAYTWLGEKEATPKYIGRELPQFPSSSGTLVFLRGYQTPRRILEIGSAYRLDPEFFQRHLDFLHRSRRPKQSLVSRIPSSQKAILRLSITTVGRLDRSLFKDINKARTEASRRMEAYLRSLKAYQHNSGDSIVRTFAMHDLKEFSIEQMATIIICKKPKDNAWLCFVWLDAGDGERDDSMGPWLGDDNESTVFEPIPLYRPNIALEHHWVDKPPFQPPHGHNIKQSIRTLPYFYGQKTHGLTARNDPFYALNELFTFVASSELFFLNLIEEQISRNMDSSVDKKSDAMESHENLAFFSRIIQEHVQHITNTLSTITSRPINEIWPKQDGQTAESASIWLSRDMSSVLEKAEALQSACVRGMDVIMTRSSLEEAKLSVSQNRRVLKLTVLASFFAPLAFTTSLFGMNFVTPSTEQGPWLVVTIAAPLVTVALLILTWDQSFVENIMLTTTNVIVEVGKALAGLSWICYAFRPLSVEELSQAVAGFEDTNAIDGPTFEVLCAGLVIIDSSGTARLLHHTAHEFLEQRNVVHTQRSHVSLTQRCVGVLQERPTVDGVRSTTSAYLRYAAENWGYHLRRAENEPAAWASAIKFLTDESAMAKATRYMENIPSHLKAKATALHLSTFFGSKALVLHCIDSLHIPVDPGATTVHAATHWALIFKKTRMLEVLLQKGANINRQDSKGRTLLHLAISNDDEASTRILLGQHRLGLDADIKDKGGSTPLHIAANENFAWAVKLLRSHCRNLAVEDKDGFNAIRLAFSKGHERIIRILVEGKADINTPSSRGDFLILHRAASNGKNDLVRFLISEGADLHKLDGDGFTPYSVVSQTRMYGNGAHVVEGGCIPERERQTWRLPPAQFHRALVQDRGQIFVLDTNRIRMFVGTEELAGDDAAPIGCRSEKHVGGLVAGAQGGKSGG